MKRKVPAKKHRQVNYPHIQQQRRLASLKDKINDPPSNPDEQEVPKSALKLMELKKNAKNTNKRKRRRKKKEELLSFRKFLDKEKKQPGMEKPEPFIPNIVQRPNENLDHFLRRAGTLTEQILKESKFEETFGVDIKKDPKTGKVLKIEKRQDETSKKPSNKIQKRKEFLKKKKEKEKKQKMAKKEKKDFGLVFDKVEFGEVVHRPPTNLPPVRGAGNLKLTERPVRTNLLLQNILTAGGNDSSKPKLTNIEKQKLEKEREFAIQAYRDLKKQNQR